MTLVEFKAKVKPALEAREVITSLESDLQVELANRDTLDSSSLLAASLVVNSIKGDPEHGEDSLLYEAVGYVR